MLDRRVGERPSAKTRCTRSRGPPSEELRYERLVGDSGGSRRAGYAGGRIRVPRPVVATSPAWTWREVLASDALTPARLPGGGLRHGAEVARRCRRPAPAVLRGLGHGLEQFRLTDERLVEAPARRALFGDLRPARKRRRRPPGRAAPRRRRAPPKPPSGAAAALLSGFAESTRRFWRGRRSVIALPTPCASRRTRSGASRWLRRLRTSRRRSGAHREERNAGGPGANALVEGAPPEGAGAVAAFFARDLAHAKRADATPSRARRTRCRAGRRRGDRRWRFHDLTARDRDRRPLSRGARVGWRR